MYGRQRGLPVSRARSSRLALYGQAGDAVGVPQLVAGLHVVQLRDLVRVARDGLVIRDEVSQGVGFGRVFWNHQHHLVVPAVARSFCEFGRAVSVHCYCTEDDTYHHQYDGDITLDLRASARSCGHDDLLVVEPAP